jgi:DNA-binding CsgD family transcriptional regulator
VEAGVNSSGGLLLEREAELSVLVAHLQAARAGQGRVVLLEGPPGIGKTSLLAALRATSHAGDFRWLAARGAEQERDHAFGVVRQLLEPAVAEEGMLEGAAALARTVLTTPAAPGGESADAGFAGLHGLFWLVHNLAERSPLVLAVDDVHWADPPSLRFLDYLAVRLDGLPVLALISTRAGDATLTVGPIARLADHPDVHALPIGPLRAEGVQRWVRAELGEAAPAGLAAACAEATGGNPFLLRALLDELRRAPGEADPDAVRRLAPASIVRSVRGRLDALDAAPVALAQATALLGDPAEIHDAALLARLDPAAAADAADTLAEAGFLEPGRPLHFVHPVVLAAVRESLRAGERAELHRQAAAILAERPGGLDAAAGHLLATDPAGDPEVVGLLLRAAQVASGRGAPDVAVTYLRRAAAEPPEAGRRALLDVELARAAGLAGEPDALALAQRAVQAAPEAEMRLTAARELALQHALAGRHDEAAAVLDAVLADADEASAGQRILAEGMLILSAGQTAPARRIHRERLERAAELAVTLGDDAPGPLLVIAGFERVVVAGDVEDGGDMVERGVDGGRLLTELSADSPFPYMAAISLIVGGRYGAAEQLLTEAVADAARRGSLRGFLVAESLRAMARFRRGDLRGAEADGRAAFEAHDGHSLLSQVYCTAALCGVLIERAELEEAERVIESLPETAHNPATHLGHHVYDMRARLRLAQGRPKDALTELEGCLFYERDMEVRRGCWSAWRAKAAEAYLALGDERRAAAAAEKALRLARELGTPRALGLSLRAAGLTAPEPERTALFAQAAGVFERGGLAVDHARVLTDLGAALAAGDRSDEARATFERALERAESAGAVLVAAAARDGLVALGARPRRREVTGSGALTPAERRIAELAAQGTANRDIAEGLFLTLKTVENHLTAVYRKLGISSRTQLADRLG